MRWPAGEVVQEWKGFVAEVVEGRFFARLLDVDTDNPFDEEVWEIPISELKPREREFLREGAYLTVRVRRNPDGVDIRFSRRRWTKREIERAKRRAERMSREIQWDACVT